MLMHIKYRSLPTTILRVFFYCAKTDAWVGFELHLKSVNLIFSHRTDLIHSILSPSVIQLLRNKVRVLKKEKTRSKLAHNPSSYKVRHPLEKLPSHPLTIIILISLFLDCSSLFELLTQSFSNALFPLLVIINCGNGRTHLQWNLLRRTLYRTYLEKARSISHAAKL